MARRDWTGSSHRCSVSARRARRCKKVLPEDPLPDSTCGAHNGHTHHTRPRTPTVVFHGGGQRVQAPVRNTARPVPPISGSEERSYCSCSVLQSHGVYVSCGVYLWWTSCANRALANQGSHETTHAGCRSRAMSRDSRIGWCANGTFACCVTSCASLAGPCNAAVRVPPRSPAFGRAGGLNLIELEA